MKDGLYYEPIARNKYAKKYKSIIHEKGIIIHPKYHFLGCSPDGLVWDNVKQ